MQCCPGCTSGSGYILSNASYAATRRANVAATAFGIGGGIGIVHICAAVSPLPFTLLFLHKVDTQSSADAQDFELPGSPY